MFSSLVTKQSCWCVNFHRKFFEFTGSKYLEKSVPKHLQTISYWIRFRFKNSTNICAADTLCFYFRCEVAFKWDVVNSLCHLFDWETTQKMLVYQFVCSYGMDESYHMNTSKRHVELLKMFSVSLLVFFSQLFTHQIFISVDLSTSTNNCFFFFQ